MAEEKIGYEPSPLHRFEISSDPISQRRYELTKRVRIDLQELPFFRELTLKGSLSKGKVLNDLNAGKTDIDLGCVVDADAVINQSEESLANLTSVYGIDRSRVETGPLQASEGNSNIFGSSKLPPGILRKLRLTRQATQSFIEKRFAKYAQDQDIGTPRAEPIVFFIAKEGPFSIYSTLSQYENVPRDDWKVMVPARRALALPFGMAMGNGLAPYRKAFFEQLQRLDPEIAEQKWQVVREAVVKNERQGNVPEAIVAEYPRNLQEAIRIYSSP